MHSAANYPLGHFVRGRASNPSQTARVAQWSDLLLRVIAKLLSKILYFAPETVSNSRNRSSESSRDLVPVVARVSERQDRNVHLAQVSHDVFQFQSRLRLATQQLS